MSENDGFENDLTRKLRESMRMPLPVAVPNIGEPIVTGNVIHRELSYEIVGAAIEVHRHLGPGQLEMVYRRAMAAELEFRQLSFELHVGCPVVYRNVEVGTFYADMIVENKVVLELKVVSELLPVHRNQLITYLRTTSLKLGMLLNFNSEYMARGIKRVVV